MNLVLGGAVCASSCKSMVADGWRAFFQPLYEKYIGLKSEILNGWKFCFYKFVFLKNELMACSGSGIILESQKVVFEMDCKSGYIVKRNLQNAGVRFLSFRGRHLIARSRSENIMG